ncbi:MAG TPA: hypothetical protein VH351_10815 [Bryobacteraceae bacterium]|jgi:hypothetical protein|nr:hypothetical protein [Bryobacteraceae bacterium]
MTESFTDNLRGPFPLSLISFLVLWLCVWMGTKFRTGTIHEQGDFSIVLGATLTLLGLIIGFTFSMAVSRYDQRKNYEEQEANAIGTEYVRADVLPGASAEKVRSLLNTYLHERILFYTTRDARELASVNDRTARLQAQLWSAVQVPAVAQPSPVVALALSGMNDVLNSQGYTQAAWWNRIPVEGWALMGLIAACANALLGYGARQSLPKGTLLVLPFMISIAFFLIADIDTPRRGIIHVSPQNLVSLSNSLHP